MSILNRPSEGLFNMVIVLYRTLLHEGPMDRDRLLALVAPVSVDDTTPPSDRMSHKSLRRWTQLGLFTDSEGKVSISKQLDRPRNKSDAEVALPGIMRNLVFAPANNENFWDAERSASADFTRAVAWMLAQDVYCCASVGNQEAASLENDQISAPDRTLFQNDTRWPGFKAWAPFLGFGVIGRYPRSGAFQIDPTGAVRDSLDAVFDNVGELSVADFIDDLAEQLPVIDRGRYRIEVESQLNRSHWEPLEETEISTSLSRALLRLREVGLLRFADRSDSPARMEMRLQGNRRLAVTHIIKEGAAS